jgi:hypothetical protein
MGRPPRPAPHACLRRRAAAPRTTSRATRTTGPRWRARSRSIARRSTSTTAGEPAARRRPGGDEPPPRDPEELAITRSTTEGLEICQFGIDLARGDEAIAEALTFHQAIGGARKEARLIYLRDTWTKRLLATGRGRMLTSLKPAPPRLAGGIATMEVDGIDPAKLAAYLWDKHRIHTIGMLPPEVRGLRVTPSVYTTLEELDRFCTVMEKVIKDGLPA